MFYPDQTIIKEGCNFTGCVQSEYSTQQLAQIFVSEGWQANAVDSGYTLTKIVDWVPAGRRSLRAAMKKTLDLVAEGSGQVSVLSGLCEYPGSFCSEIRQILWRRLGRANSLVCHWLDTIDGTVFRQVPATAELLGLNPDSLIEADLTAISAGLCYPAIEGRLDVPRERLAKTVPIWKSSYFSSGFCGRIRCIR